MQALKTMLLTALCLFQALHAAEPIKWVDDQGNVHYSDTAPKGITAQPIDSSSMSTMDYEKANQGLYELNKTFDAQRELNQRDQRRLEEEQQKLYIRCEKLRSSLKILQRPSPVYTKGGSGTRNYIDDEQREKEINDTQYTLKKHCP